MRIQGSGLNPLPIRFDRVRTIVLQSEFDPDELYVYAYDLDRRRCLSYDAAKKDRYLLIFLVVFVAVSLCDASKKQAKEKALDMEAAEKMIIV